MSLVIDMFAFFVLFVMVVAFVLMIKGFATMVQATPQVQPQPVQVRQFPIYGLLKTILWIVALIFLAERFM